MEGNYDFVDSATVYYELGSRSRGLGSGSQGGKSSMLYLKSLSPLYTFSSHSLLRLCILCTPVHTCVLLCLPVRSCALGQGLCVPVRSGKGYMWLRVFEPSCGLFQGLNIHREHSGVSRF
jgi:hypothetical protein